VSTRFVSNKILEVRREQKQLPQEKFFKITKEMGGRHLQHVDLFKQDEMRKWVHVHKELLEA
jgi:hypothetical protein